MPGMALEKTACSQPNSLGCTISTHGVFRIFGASWVKAAGITQPGTQNKLVGSDQPYKNSAHSDTCPRICCSSPRTSGRSFRPAACRILTTISTASNSPRMCRYASRMARFIFARSVASLTLRLPTTSPRRPLPPAGSLLASTTISRPCRRQGNFPPKFAPPLSLA
jgi:hypothetical protein